MADSFAVVLVLICLFVALSLPTTATGFANTRRKHMEKAKFLSNHHVYEDEHVRKDQEHEVVFAVKLNNVDRLFAELDAVSYMSSPKYGQHWSRAEVKALTANPEAVQEITTFLHEIGAAHEVDRYGEFIKAKAPLSKWEEVLATKFNQYHDKKLKKDFIRAEEYSLPESVASHVFGVFNVADYTPIYKHNLKIRPMDKNMLKGKNLRVLSSNIYPDTVTPQLIWKHYDVSTTSGNNNDKMAVFESLGQTMSPSDLTAFQEYLDLAVEGITQDIGGYVDDVTCVDHPDYCTEANLDIQYMMGVAQHVPSVYYYTDLDWLPWIMEVAAMSDPPKVFSISYGSTPDSYFTQEYINAFDAQLAQLGLEGVTILASSGDAGVGGSDAINNSTACAYVGQFPCASPYVTCVGATQGPENSKPEVQCTLPAASFTGGGGFSDTYKRPSWQDTAVADYFANVGTQPVAGYNTTGRGYPDVSLLGFNYIVIIGGSGSYVGGTSASCPVMAGFIALINSLRRDSGMSTVGWINPTLYTNTSYANDITSGTNMCTEASAGGEGTFTGTCCTQGFYSSTGWDPVTGWGSVNFDKLATIFGVSSGGDGSSHSSVLSAGEAAGVAIGCIVAVALIGVALWFFGAFKCFTSTSASSAGKVYAQ